MSGCVSFSCLFIAALVVSTTSQPSEEQQNVPVLFLGLLRPCVLMDNFPSSVLYSCSCKTLFLVFFSSGSGSSKMAMSTASPPSSTPLRIGSSSFKFLGFAAHHFFFLERRSSRDNCSKFLLEQVLDLPNWGLAYGLSRRDLRAFRVEDADLLRGFFGGGVPFLPPFLLLLLFLLPFFYRFFSFLCMLWNNIGLICTASSILGTQIKSASILCTTSSSILGTQINSTSILCTGSITDGLLCTLRGVVSTNSAIVCTSCTKEIKNILADYFPTVLHNIVILDSCHKVNTTNESKIDFNPFKRVIASSGPNSVLQEHGNVYVPVSCYTQDSKTV